MKWNSNLPAGLILFVAFTAAARIAAACVGDCDARGVVSVADVIKGVRIALGEAPADLCQRIDANGDGEVTIDELVKAVDNALVGCPTVLDQAWEGPVGACEAMPSTSYNIRGFNPIGQ